MISLSVLNARTHHILISADEPVRVESSNVAGAPIVHIYRGAEIDTNAEPVGAYDGTEPEEGRTSWEEPTAPPALRDAFRAAKGCAATLRILSGDEVGDGTAWQEEARRLAVHLRELGAWFDEVAGGAPGADEVARVAALAAGLDD